MRRISSDHMMRLRNEVNVLAVICDLRVPTTFRGSHLTFRCPVCRRHHTRLNHRVNLAYCFICRRGFNPIDLAMKERGWRFLEAVEYLERLHTTH